MEERMDTLQAVEVESRWWWVTMGKAADVLRAKVDSEASGWLAGCFSDGFASDLLVSCRCRCSGRGRQTQFDQFGTVASAQASHPPLHMLTPVAGVAAGKLQEGIDGCHRLPYLVSHRDLTPSPAQPSPCCRSSDTRPKPQPSMPRLPFPAKKKKFRVGPLSSVIPLCSAGLWLVTTREEKTAWRVLYIVVRWPFLFLPSISLPL
ncbi:hypothetical protein IWZ03DRAFT_384156 [Phyllosticta citriasiana]|uniref:Uncharacterized protein n=1 Tax=Phyllosticta citriasiana TaxID=595635 RepID=A0ABR1KIW5_9PEZI